MMEVKANLKNLNIEINYCEFNNDFKSINNRDEFN